MRLVQDTCDGAKSWQILDETLGRKIEKFPSLADDRYASSDHITNFKNTIFTLTVGANDGAFIRLEKDCLTTGCSTAQGTAYETTLAATGRDISGIVQNLKAADASLIVVNEYPAPDWGDTSCLDSQSTSRDQTILRTELHNLNTTIADSAQSAGAVVVAPTDFKDHGICAIDPWIQWRGVGGTMALHPTAAGQQALAARNEAAVRAYVENN
jgi:lysophospholipase L1-like esterase